MIIRLMSLMISLFISLGAGVDVDNWQGFGWFPCGFRNGASFPLDEIAECSACSFSFLGVQDLFDFVFFLSLYDNGFGPSVFPLDRVFRFPI